MAYAKLAEQGFKPQQIKLLYVTHSIPLAMEAGSAPSAEELERFPRLANEISYVAQHQALIEALQPALEWALGVKQVNADLAYCSRLARRTPSGLKATLMTCCPSLTEIRFRQW